MPKAHNPRHGSMQFWPRKRAKRAYARVHYWVMDKNVKLLGFAGYKAGMIQVSYIDNIPNSMSKGELVSSSATVLECPPLKILGATFSKQTPYGLKTYSQILSKNLDKELERKIKLPKKDTSKTDVNFDGIVDVKVLVHTQPKLTGMGKKKPEIFEIGLGGSVEEKINYVKESLGKEISIKDVLQDGQALDIHAVTRGKGYQGPVKRFGVKIRNHKSEKTIRGPGSLGGWKGQGHTMYRVAHAGQMGYHTRTEFNKWLLKIGSKVDEVNPKGGFKQYGLVKSDYIIIMGSVGGSRKRLVRLNYAIRPNKLPKESPQIEVING